MKPIANEAQINTLTFSWIADSIPALACYIDKNLSYRFMNAKYRKMFKLADEVKVEDYKIFQIIGEVAYARAKPSIEKALQGEFVSYEFELDSTEIPRILQVHYVPDFIDEANLTEGVRGFFMMALDVTELRLTQANYKRDLLAEVESKTEHLSTAITDLKKAQSQLLEQEKMASLGLLVAGVAHELNTPLGTSLTAVTSLQENTQETLADLNDKKLTSSKLTHFLEENLNVLALTEKNIKNASKLIQTFKNVSGSQSKEAASHCHISELVHNMLRVINNGYANQEVSYAVSINDQLNVHTYPTLLVQIFTHLINNSHLHGFIEEQPYKITIDIELRENTLHICYQDDGTGLNSEAKKYMFDPFFTTKPASESTGLGMTILYNIIHGQLAGEIIIDKDRQTGVKIDILFPVNEDT
jgi:signal transduction histidine kinase